MRRIVLPLVFLLNVAITCAFTTNYTEAYFDKDWKRTTAKGDAHYYRRVTFTDSLYQFVDFYTSNGMIQGSGTFWTLENEERIGLFRFYYINGNIESEGNYINNLADGEWKRYNDEGKLLRVETYKNDTLHGQLISYHPSGTIKRIDLYEMGDWRYGICFDKDGIQTDYYSYCKKAEYPTGTAGLERDLAKAMKVPKYAKQSGLTGIVYLNLEINNKGVVEKVNIIESTERIFDEPAIKAVSKLMNFRPATFDGEPCASKLLLNLHF